MENHRLRHIRSLDFDSHFLPDHFFFSVDSSIISVNALPWAFNWSRMLLSTNESVDPVSKIALVSMEAVPLERVMGTIRELNSRYKSLLSKPRRQCQLSHYCYFVSSTFQVYCRHCAEVYCDAYCNHLCHKFDWLCTD